MPDRRPVALISIDVRVTGCRARMFYFFLELVITAAVLGSQLLTPELFDIYEKRPARPHSRSQAQARNRISGDGLSKNQRVS